MIQTVTSTKEILSTGLRSGRVVNECSSRVEVDRFTSNREEEVEEVEECPSTSPAVLGFEVYTFFQ